MIAEDRVAGHCVSLMRCRSKASAFFWPAQIVWKVEVGNVASFPRVIELNLKAFYEGLDQFYLFQYRNSAPLYPMLLLPRVLLFL